jgi:CHAD domain-containing protein
MGTEEERKFAVDARFVLPDLSGCVPAGGRAVVRPPVTMRATYFDTADLRLARAGVSLRYRSGDDDAPWTVKLPTVVPGTRHEISRPATPMPGRRVSAAAVPPDLVALVTVYLRGATLRPTVTIRTTRTRVDLRDRDDVLLAEVADDMVGVLDDRRVLGRFREIEVERKAGRRKLLRRAGDALVAGGAVEGGFVPKHIRAMMVTPALAAIAVAPPDLIPPLPELPTNAAAGEAITAALRTDIGHVLHHDPLVRLQFAVEGGDTAVHQMRVGVRRLRCTLRQFAPLFAGDWASSLADELRWLNSVLGPTRDAEVLRARLRDVIDADPSYPLDGAAVARIDAELAARHEDARTALDQALASPRYAALVDRLVATAAAPDFRPVASQRADALLHRFVARAWHRLAYGRRGIDGAIDLDARASDEQWHRVRIAAKRARYVAEATVPAIGTPARDFAARLSTVTDILGVRQDAVIAGATWLSVAASDPDDHALAVTAGRLIERERMAARKAGQAYPAAWHAASGHQLTAWLS